MIEGQNHKLLGCLELEDFDLQFSRMHRETLPIGQKEKSRKSQFEKLLPQTKLKMTIQKEFQQLEKQQLKVNTNYASTPNGTYQRC